MGSQPKREHPRAWLTGAVLLGLFALYMCVVVVRGLTLAVQHSRLGYVRWPTVPVFLLIILGSGYFALRFWRKWLVVRRRRVLGAP